MTDEAIPKILKFSLSTLEGRIKTATVLPKSVTILADEEQSNLKTYRIITE